MKPLIDADVLRYEVGVCGQEWDDDDYLVMKPFEELARLFDDKVREICEMAWGDEPPTLFLSCCPDTHRILQRRNGTPYKKNFRLDVAVTKPYKGTRNAEKPLHYENLTAYILNCYDCVVAVGMEADDMLAIYQTQALKEGRETIICSRDKDLRAVPGWHYGWECHNQAGFGPKQVRVTGALTPVYKDEKIKSLKGEGHLFFCAQMLMGDPGDNIPGIPRVGCAKAYDLLKDCERWEDALVKVRDAYKEKYADEWETHFLEQARLLWMVRELNEDGSPKMFEIPEFLYEGVHCERLDEEGSVTQGREVCAETS